MYVCAGIDRKQNELAKKNKEKRSVVSTEGAEQIEKGRTREGMRRERKRKKTNQNTESIHTPIGHELNERRRMCHAPKMQNQTAAKQIRA